MKQPFISKEQFAKMNNVSVERLNEQYRDNAAQMRKTAEKARKLGKKVNGLTADQWDEKAKSFEELAAK